MVDYECGCEEVPTAGMSCLFRPQCPRRLQVYLRVFAFIKVSLGLLRFLKRIKELRNVAVLLLRVDYL